MPDTFTTYLLICAAAFVAGVMNSVAGGGTLLTFPALLSVVSPSVANATSTIALMPGSIAGTWAYRREFVLVWPIARRLLLPSFLGGLLGALFLIWYPERFGPLVPWLILAAAVLFLIQAPLMKIIKRHPATGPGTDSSPVRSASPGLMLAVFVFQFGVAMYGGYFGAGIGILMLTALGFLGVGDLHRMNAIKTFLASVINGVAVVIFISGDIIHWPYAGAMAVAAILGGYTGARVARRLPSAYVRWVVILIGFSLAAYYFVRS